VRLVGFVKKELVTMHGHLTVLPVVNYCKYFYVRSYWLSFRTTNPVHFPAFCNIQMVTNITALIPCHWQTYLISALVAGKL